MLNVTFILTNFIDAGSIPLKKIRNLIENLKSEDVQVHELQDPDRKTLVNYIRKNANHLFFPLTMHSYVNMEGEITAFDFNIFQLLERMQVNFVGSGYLTQLLVRDKAISISNTGIAPQSIYLDRSQEFEPEIDITNTQKVIIKPNNGTGSMGISNVLNSEQLASGIAEYQNNVDGSRSQDLVIQDYRDSCREFSVTIIGNGPEKLTGITEIKPKNGDAHVVYDSKQKNRKYDERNVVFEVVYDQEIISALTFHALRIFDWYNIKDYARLDFIYIDKPYLIDINSIPVTGKLFSIAIKEKYELADSGILSPIIYSAISRLNSAGITTLKPDSLTNELNELTRSVIAESRPVDAVPESTIPSHFIRHSDKFTMVDRIAAETDTLYFLKALVHLLKPRFVLETGTYKGSTARAMGEALKAINFGQLTTIELDEALALEAAKNLADLPVKVVNSSSLDYIPDQPVDLLFLDSHRPLRVKELFHYKNYLQPQTIIVWHDSSPEHADVFKAVNKLKDDLVLDAVLLPSPRGLTISKLR